MSKTLPLFVFSRVSTGPVLFFHMSIPVFVTFFWGWSSLFNFKRFLVSHISDRKMVILVVPLLLLYQLCRTTDASEMTDFRMRRAFHSELSEKKHVSSQLTLNRARLRLSVSDKSCLSLQSCVSDDICRERPELPSCTRQYTLRDYREELGKQTNEVQTQSFQASRRADWVDDEIDEKDIEYYLWRKRRRQWLRRKAAMYVDPVRWEMANDWQVERTIPSRSGQR